MAAVTAAVVAGVATVAATGMQVAQSQGAFGGGGGGGSGGKVTKIPPDPADKAMRDWADRMVIANADKTYPGFGEFLQSGGDPAKAQFDLTVPDLKPSEAAAVGFVGGKGEAIPTVSQEGLASGDITNLTPEQRLYLAKERYRSAKAAGQEPGPWASRVNRLSGRIDRLQGRLENFASTPEVEPREQRIQDRLTRVKGKLEKATTAGDRYN